MCEGSEEAEEDNYMEYLDEEEALELVNDEDS